MPPDQTTARLLLRGQARHRIAVVGSLIMDLVFRADRRPGPGETFTGEEFGMFLGGKGFNQAIACHRLGAQVTLIGRVGEDLFGEMFTARLGDEGIGIDFITRDREIGTGVASPVVFPDGENSIIGVPRANRRVTRADIDRAEYAIAAADVLMLQLEVNPEASGHAAALARKHNTAVMLDPAPAHLHTDIEAWHLDYLVPNEVEARLLAGRTDPVEFARQRVSAGLRAVEARLLAGRTDPVEFARQRVSAGLRAVVISQGKHGAVIVDAAGDRNVPAFRVAAVDSTGAGDAFRAGLAVKLAQGTGIDQAVRYAGACGALACTRMGAEPSMPTASEVEDYLRRTDEHPD